MSALNNARLRSKLTREEMQAEAQAISSRCAYIHRTDSALPLLLSVLQNKEVAGDSGQWLRLTHMRGSSLDKAARAVGHPDTTIPAGYAQTQVPSRHPHKQTLQMYMLQFDIATDSFRGVRFGKDPNSSGVWPVYIRPLCLRTSRLRSPRCMRLHGVLVVDESAKWSQVERTLFKQLIYNTAVAQILEEVGIQFHISARGEVSASNSTQGMRLQCAC